MTRISSFILHASSVVPAAIDFKIKRGIVSEIVENPIPGISTIENVNDHSARRLACYSWYAKEKIPRKRGFSTFIWSYPVFFDAERSLFSKSRSDRCFYSREATQADSLVASAPGQVTCPPPEFRSPVKSAGESTSLKSCLDYRNCFEKTLLRPTGAVWDLLMSFSRG